MIKFIDWNGTSCIFVYKIIYSKNNWMMILKLNVIDDIILKLNVK